MSSAKQKKATFISHKLTFLKDQGDELISAVGQYVSRITVVGDSWTPGGDNNMDFQKLCLMIDSASLFLCEKCEELADLTSQSITAAATTPATSYRQPAAPLASTATTSYRQSTESVQPADGAHTKQILDRIVVIEEAMGFFRSRTENVSAQQCGIDQQLKELSSKLSELEKGFDQQMMELSSNLSESEKGIDQQLKELSSKLSESEKGFDQQLKELSSKLSESENGFDQQLNELSSHLSESEKGIDQQLMELSSKLSESDKKHSSRFKQIKQQISDIGETQDATEQEQKTRLHRLEKQLHKISTTQNRLKVEMESQAELVEKLVHVPNLLESVKENVDALDARIETIVDDCRNNHKDIETVTRETVDKVVANTQNVQLISEGQAQNTTLLRELETRLQTLKADGVRNVKDVQKQAEKGEENFRILCQMLNDRLRPLEQLRTCLNERATARDDNITKIPP